MDLHVPGVGAVFGIGDDLHVPGGGAVLGSSMVPAPLEITPAAIECNVSTAIGSATIAPLPDIVAFDALVWTTPAFELNTTRTPAFDANVYPLVDFDLER